MVLQAPVGQNLRVMERHLQGAGLSSGLFQLTQKPRRLIGARPAIGLENGQGVGKGEDLCGSASELGHIPRLAGADAFHILFELALLDGEACAKMVAIGQDLLHGDGDLHLQPLPRQPHGASPEHGQEGEREKSRRSAAESEVDCLFDHRSQRSNGQAALMPQRRGASKGPRGAPLSRGPAVQNGFQVERSVNFR